MRNVCKLYKDEARIINKNAINNELDKLYWFYLNQGKEENMER